MHRRRSIEDGNLRKLFHVIFIFRIIINLVFPKILNIQNNQNL